MNDNDRKELARHVGELMKQHAEAGQANTNPFEELGATIARGIETMTWAPRLSGLRWIMFRIAMDKGDEKSMMLTDEYYERGCQEFISRFGIDEMWEHTHSFDRPHFRQELVDQGVPVTFTNLFLAALARIEKEQETE